MHNCKFNNEACFLFTMHTNFGSINYDTFCLSHPLSVKIFIIRKTCYGFISYLIPLFLLKYFEFHQHRQPYGLYRAWG